MRTLTSTTGTHSILADFNCTLVRYTLVPVYHAQFRGEKSFWAKIDDFQEWSLWDVILTAGNNGASPI